MPVGWTIGFIGSPATVTSSATGSTSVSVGPFTLTYLTSDNSDNNASGYTFSGINFGSAAANRLIIVAVHNSGPSGKSLSSITIGGVTGTIVKNQTSGFAGVAIAQALVPSGTSGTVVVTLSGSNESCGIGVWSVITNTQGAQFTGASTGGSSIAATVPSSGGAITAYTTSGSGVGNASTPSNFTERYDFNPDEDADGNDGRYTGGDFTSSATINVTNSSGGSEVLVYASWGP